MARVKPLNAPTDVFLELTSICNLACQHCNVYPYRQDPNEFSLEEWVRLFDRFVELKVFTVVVSGGEPFARKDMFDLLDALDERPIRIKQLNTNATLVNEEIAARLKEYKKLGPVQVGLDGATTETHDKLRGQGNFERAIRGTRRLLDAGLPVTFFTVFTKYNRHEIRAMAELARELGVVSINYCTLLPQGNALHYFEEIALTDAEWRECVTEVGEVSKEYPGLASGPMKQCFDHFARFEEVLAEVGEAGPRYLSGCNTGVTECTIMPDGRVLPCDRLQELTCGNLREQDLQEIWLESPVFERFRERFDVLLDDLDTCRGCRYQPLCTGGCPSLPYYLEGELIARDPYSCYKFFKGEEVLRA
ncbi:MAG: radical SAM protein [Planctomycetota bacterium]|jgi:SynChlorMet cassette radical SAM/SPASM protein ScmE